jgi:HSP20 family protein
MTLTDRLDRAARHLQGLPEFDTFVEQILGPGPRKRTYIPRTNIVESTDGWTISMELPGVLPEDVSVEIVDGRLTVSGEKKADSFDETTTVRRRERLAGKFERTFEFSDAVDLDRIQASHRHGLLVVDVPKAEKARPRKIEIASSQE